MTKTLHILNGDSTLWQLDDIGMEGDRLVWRDVLCEGPVSVDFGSKAFWEERTQFMASAFEVSTEDFDQKVIQEFKKVESLHQYEEVVLWFEYDLFCQINLIGLLAYLQKYSPEDLTISLVCAGDEPGFNRLVGLGELPVEALPKLFEERVILNKEDLQYATEVYAAYCSDNPGNLMAAAVENSKFPYLQGAIQAHLRRFPEAESGLNEIELAILKAVEANSGYERKVVGQMLQWQKGTYYGFGDGQYFIYLKRLTPLLNEEGALTQVAKEILSQQCAADGLISRNQKLGGASMADYVFKAPRQIKKRQS